MLGTGIRESSAMDSPVPLVSSAPREWLQDTVLPDQEAFREMSLLQLPPAVRSSSRSSSSYRDNSFRDNSPDIRIDPEVMKFLTDIRDLSVADCYRVFVVLRNDTQDHFDYLFQHVPQERKTEVSHYLDEQMLAFIKYALPLRINTVIRLAFNKFGCYFPDMHQFAQDAFTYLKALKRMRSVEQIREKIKEGMSPQVRKCVRSILTTDPAFKHVYDQFPYRRVDAFVQSLPTPITLVSFAAALEALKETDFADYEKFMDETPESCGELVSMIRNVNRFFGRIKYVELQDVCCFIVKCHKESQELFDFVVSKLEQDGLLQGRILDCVTEYRRLDAEQPRVRKRARVEEENS